MGIEHDVSDSEKITIRITDSVSNESLHEFMQAYVAILTSLKSLGQKRTYLAYFYRQRRIHQCQSQQRAGALSFSSLQMQKAK